MTTVKLKFRPSAVAGKEGILYYQITHHRAVRSVKTPYRIYPDEWDGSSGAVFDGNAGPRRSYLQVVRDCVDWNLRQIKNVAVFMERHEMETGETVSMSDIIVAVKRIIPCQTVFVFMRSRIAYLIRMNRIGTANTYSATLRSFMRFRRSEDLSFESVSIDTIDAYEAYLKSRGLVRNTTSFYMRTMRTAYNLAVEQGLTADRGVFRHVYTGFDKTGKRAISLNDIKAISRLDLSCSHTLSFARDMFLLSFYMRGMPFVDMAYLRKTDLKDGFVVYCRKKTRQRLTIEWETHMQVIVERYAGEASSTPYLLPIIKEADGMEYRQYLKVQHKVNRSLKRIAAMAGLGIPLTMYVARHTWATVARKMNIPMSVISEGMGHDSEKTTQIYLASIDTSEIDKANRRILNSI